LEGKGREVSLVGIESGKEVLKRLGERSRD
jgi:hypothetical protein